MFTGESMADRYRHPQRLVHLAVCVTFGAGLWFMPLSSLAAKKAVVELPDSKNRVIEVNDQGVAPKELRISSDDVMVFLLNDTSNSLVTFEIDYGKADVHCSNANVKNFPDGKARSIKPLGPRDFTATCFHEKGSYPIKILGLNGKKDPYFATVVLE